MSIIDHIMVMVTSIIVVSILWFCLSGCSFLFKEHFAGGSLGEATQDEDKNEVALFF